jgi:hypothetical protein
MGLQWPAMACNGPKVCSVAEDFVSDFSQMLHTYSESTTLKADSACSSETLGTQPKFTRYQQQSAVSSQQSASPSPSLSARGMPVTAYGILTLGVVCTAWSIYVHTCRCYSLQLTCFCSTAFYLVRSYQSFGDNNCLHFQDINEKL